MMRFLVTIDERIRGALKKKKDTKIRIQNLFHCYLKEDLLRRAVTGWNHRVRVEINHKSFGQRIVIVDNKIENLHFAL